MHSNPWQPELWMIFPFIGLLLSIAVVPIVASNFWHKIRHQVLLSGIFALPIGILCFFQARSELWHSLEHYFSFVVLLSSLFIVSGGVVLAGNLKGTPAMNVLFLGLGALLSNLIGTTGASMVLIRPLLRANQHRKTQIHIPIFFILIVSNISGLLTPLGDPPLFLGYLLGVPFFWTFKLFPFWLLAVSLLLILFYVIDWIAARNSLLVDKDSLSRSSGFAIQGKRNLIFLGMIIGAVFLSAPYREVVLILAACISFWITPKSYHRQNNFSFYPIKEVAVLFLGLFITMIPALELLKIHGGSLGIEKQWQFFWATGLFSALLDNAPTYLTFLTVAQGLNLGGPFLNVPENLLASVSVAAVFFGGLTYIGNAPNFMVRAIAEENGWNMPRFFEYVVKAGMILLPLFGLVTVLFFMKG